MARSGDSIKNRVIGDQITFCTTAAESDGILLGLGLTITSNRHQIVEHIHPHQEEYFTVCVGTLWLRVDEHEQTLKADERVIVTAGTPHVWWNERAHEVRVGGAFRLAHKTESSSSDVLPQSRRSIAPTWADAFLPAVMTLHDDTFLARPPVPLPCVVCALFGPRV